MQLRITTEKFHHRSIRITSTSVPSVVRDWIKFVQNEYAYLLRRNRLIVGLGVRRSEKNIAVSLQLSVGRFCLVFQLLHAERVPDCLINFLTDPSISFVGIWNEEDSKSLEASEHQLKVSKLIDVREVIAERLKFNSEEVERIVGLVFDHRNTVTDWSLKVLPKEQIRYLCMQTCLCLLWGISFDIWSVQNEDRSETSVVVATCSFVYASLTILPPARIPTLTNFIPMLWKLIKHCHDNQDWSCFSEHSTFLPRSAPGWLLPLAVFCPIYNHMLLGVDVMEFQQLEKPLSLKDIECLVLLLRKTLWQVLYLDSPLSRRMAKSAPIRLIQHRVSLAGAKLLSQLREWNNRHQFTPSSAFQPVGASERFKAQVIAEGSMEHEVLKQVPFLVPLKSRVQIFNSQLSAAKIRNSVSHVRIRRDHIFEDAFRQLSTLSEKSLKAMIRVTYVNKHGIQEAGIDEGGLFKDFMEKITQIAFSPEFGLFEESTVHLLYPNPKSAIKYQQHLQYFHFLGTLLAKAMFEGILVDIRFASFFLRKLKQKHNNLNDLPSLDPVLYRNLIELQHDEDDTSRFGFNFVIEGVQTVEDLLPGGKDLLVTNQNVTEYIHLVANYRLNVQIHQQTSHFLKGFQQLIKKDWIDIFTEDELQLMISGSADGIDLDDLRSNTNYAGGYHSDHVVIDMFWEVVKSFSTEDKKKFLKFVTGCSRGPLLGFGYLRPSFCIQGTGGEASQEALDRLPTSSTCANLLKLPPYQSKEQMEWKLLYSIDADAGFDLS